MVLFLTDADVARLASMDDALVSVREALAAQGAGRADNAPRQRARLSRAVVNVMGGAVQAPTTGTESARRAGWMGAKVSVAASDRKKAWMMLFDEEGVLRCILEANRLGQLRTGAATGVSTDVLARGDSRVLACLGSGYQARTQVEAVTRVRNIERVHVWSRTSGHAQNFARRLRADLGLTVKTFDRACDAVDTADVVVTITATATPILTGADVRTGTHVVLAGSNDPQRREADSGLFTRARAVYVDDLTQARDVSGDLRMAVEEGALDWADVRTLGSVVAQTRSSRADLRQEGGTTVFCSQGIGSWDVALASTVHDRALDRGVGATLALDGAPVRER